MKTAGVARELTIRYAAALLMIAAFASFALLALQVITRQSEGDGAFINLAGRQRMLSQQIALRASELRVDYNLSDLARLRVSILEMTDAHQALAHGGPHPWLTKQKPLSPVLHAIYFDPPHSTDRTMREFLAAAARVVEKANEGVLGENDPDMARVLALSDGPLLSALEAAAAAYEAESEAAILRTERIEGAIWISTLVMLLVVAVIFFAPAIARLKKSMSATAAAQAALEKSEERFRGAYEAAPYGMGIVDTEGRWISANSALCDLLEYSEAELLARDFQSVTHPDDKTADEAALKALVSGEIDGRSIEKRYLTKGGEHVPVQVSVSTVREKNGAVRHLVAQVIDLRERLRIEEERREALRARAVGRLAAGMAHELNNLFTAVLGNIELLQTASAPTPKSRQRLEKLAALISRGAALTRQVLSFAQQQPLINRPVDINRLVDDRLQAFKEAVGSRQTLQAVLPDDELIIDVDWDRFQEAVCHLLANARDASPEGGVITLQTEKVEFTDRAAPLGLKPGAYVALAIEDCGAGASSGDLPLFVEPFYTTKAATGATGLGLSMVDGFVRQSGGSLEFTKSECGGLRVSLYLPECAAIAGAGEQIVDAA